MVLNKTYNGKRCLLLKRIGYLVNMLLACKEEVNLESIDVFADREVLKIPNSGHFTTTLFRRREVENDECCF